MTWLGQVRHLVIKDLTEHRWMVGLYLAAVVVATGHTLGWEPFEAPVLGVTMGFIGLIGGVLAASIVQGDSPTRGDAFWASHPIDASAALAAKLSFAIVLLALPVLAQTVAVHSYDVAWGAALSSAIHAAPLFALIVLGALVVGALTRDIKSFMLAVIAIPVALIIATIILSKATRGRGPTITSEQFAAATMTCALIELVLLAWLYHTRDGRWGTRIVGFALAGLSFVGLALASEPSRKARPRDTSGVPRVPLRVDWSSRRGFQSVSPFAMELIIGPGPQGLRYGVENPGTLVNLRNGSTVELWVASIGIGPSTTISSALPPTAGIRWLNDRSSAGAAGDGEVRVLLDPIPNDEQRSALEAGVESVVLSGNVNVSALTLGPTLPLTPGAEVVRGGRRIDIESWRSGPAVPQLGVRSRTVIDRDAFVFQGTENPLQHALVNSGRGEGITLSASATQFGADGMVIPGSTMRSELVRYVLPNGPGGVPIVDDAWLRGARLQVVDSKPLGSYPFRLPPLVTKSPPDR